MTVEIKHREIKGATAGPRLLITGGVHGDEFEPMIAIRRLMRCIDPASLRGTVVLAPVVNEPAFDRKDRCGPDGLDLARTFPGDPDGSVTQRIAHALAQWIRQADAFIDLHTGGTTIGIWPLAGYMLHPDKSVLDTQRRMAHAMNLPVVWGTDPNLQGRSLSVARDANMPAIYAEYGGSATCSPAGVDAYVEGCLNVIAELDMIDRPRPPSRVQNIVEDPRDNSGHLQIQNPAPFAGCFEPAVRLGERVRSGDKIGTLCDVLGQRVETIESKQTGIVLTLRTFPRVQEGDALAVILETGDNSSELPLGTSS